MKKCLITGLIILLPVLITIIFLQFFLNLLTDPFARGVSYILHQIGLLHDGFGIFSQKQMINGISRIAVLVGLALLILVVGMCTPVSFARALFFRMEAVIEKIPFVNVLYRVSKELIHSLVNPHVSNFNLPAVVCYPSFDEKAMGIVMNEFKSDILGDPNQEFAAVIIPCTPNLTTGVLCIFEKKEVQYTGQTLQKAFEFIMSFGNSTKQL